MEVWQTSNLRRLRLGEEKKNNRKERKKKEQTTAWKYIWSALFHRATIKNTTLSQNSQYQQHWAIGYTYEVGIKCQPIKDTAWSLSHYADSFWGIQCEYMEFIQLWHEYCQFATIHHLPASSNPCISQRIEYPSASSHSPQQITKLRHKCSKQHRL